MSETWMVLPQEPAMVAVGDTGTLAWTRDHHVLLGRGDVRIEMPAQPTCLCVSGDDVFVGLANKSLVVLRAPMLLPRWVGTLEAVPRSVKARGQFVCVDGVDFLVTRQALVRQPRRSARLRRSGSGAGAAATVKQVPDSATDDGVWRVFWRRSTLVMRNELLDEEIERGFTDQPDHWAVASGTDVRVVAVFGTDVCIINVD